MIALRSSTGAAQYSTESSRRAANGECDDELAAKLESEIQVEQEAKSEQQPASIKDFLANSPFELVDTPGEETVKLVREFGKEKSVHKSLQRQSLIDTEKKISIVVHNFFIPLQIY